MLTKPIFIVAPFSLTLAAAQHGSGNDSRLMFSDEIVSCYKDPAELVLFHDVEMEMQKDSLTLFGLSRLNPLALDGAAFVLIVCALIAGLLPTRHAASNRTFGGFAGRVAASLCGEFVRFKKADQVPNTEHYR
jgi:hypothetical protein